MNLIDSTYLKMALNLKKPLDTVDFLLAEIEELSPFRSMNWSALEKRIQTKIRELISLVIIMRHSLNNDYAMEADRQESIEILIKEY